MKICCLKNSYINTAEEYTISCLLNRCGFFFEWVSDAAAKKEEALLLIYDSEENPEKNDSGVIHLYKQFNLRELSKINYEWAETKIGNRRIPLLKNPESPAISSSNPSISSFDLIANLYFHLTRIEEIHFKHPEDVDKQVQKSILFKHGNFMVPVIDILAELFQQNVQTKFRDHNLFLTNKAFYPAGEDFGIALTHDVDFIRAFHPLKKIILKLSILAGFKKDKNVEEIEKSDQMTWGFDRLLAFYKENNFRATFFFMAKYLEGLHFRYQIKSKKIKKLLSDIVSQSHEVAFHPSRYAFEHPARYLREKTRLEKISGANISGLRHHYLRCLFPDIWRKAAELNLKYEAGMIHRRYGGFRAGTCFPFPAFDHNNQEFIDIIELPTIFFENTLPDSGNDTEASKNKIQELLSVVKNLGGLLNILWHSNNIFQPDNYNELWNFIIDLIKKENAYIHPLAEHYNWHKLRNQICMESFQKTDTGYVIELQIPQGTEQFCLFVPENYHYMSKSALQYDRIQSKLVVYCNGTATKLVIEAQAI